MSPSTRTFGSCRVLSTLFVKLMNTLGLFSPGEQAACGPSPGDFTSDYWLKSNFGRSWTRSQC